jgi:hypothetical protein
MGMFHSSENDFVPKMTNESCFNIFTTYRRRIMNWKLAKRAIVFQLDNDATEAWLLTQLLWVELV